MGDDIGSGSVTDCCLRSDSDPLSSTNLPYGENQNKPFYWFRCHHPLITKLNGSNGELTICISITLYIKRPLMGILIRNMGLADI